ncbi:MAG: tryptophan 2,3-dioxygenase [Deltaproteobacteria bacterium]|nr:tryptophan 2,3-dioxygenase [Deltaproteobacteria bacterium]
MTSKHVTYQSYLKLDQLLALQAASSEPPEHDELLFIVIHQVYELWFKLTLHELDKVHRDLRNGELFDAIAGLKRVRTILKTLVGQLDVLETMTPISFASFRHRLEASSGFQSVQFRELEYLLGYKRPEMLVHYEKGTPSYAQLERRLDDPSLMDALYHFLEGRGAEIPKELLTRNRRQPTEPSEAFQRELLRLYRDEQDLAVLLELLTDLDEGLQEWRYRHVKMVERTIGTKSGTGGSSGVAFLQKSLFKPVFPDLWALRNLL